MITLSTVYGNLIERFPSEAHTITKISDLYSAAGREYSLDGLFSLTSPKSTKALLSILSALVEKKLLQKKFRVISPSCRESIIDFEAITEIPHSVLDWHTGDNLTITPDTLKIVYKSK